MKVIRSLPEMTAWSRNVRAQNSTIAFVPTMGYLHEGHLNLIRRARQEADRTVVSIFVNPAQFGPNEDLDRYPRDFDRDERLCRQEGADVVFYPAAGDMYTPGHQTFVVSQQWASVLCGASRPTHFQGVTTVVSKLFHIVEPDIAIFGQKDAQQALIIRRMVADLNFNIRIIVCPIVRENDGLAMSSRNHYLSPDQRREAAVIFRSLQMAADRHASGSRDWPAIKSAIGKMISEQSSGRIDYVEILDADTLTAPTGRERSVLIAVAVFFGKTRLIDNIVLENEPVNTLF